MGEIRLGTSGYSFQDWKGVVYPANIKDSEMFSYYVSQLRFNTVEMNYTYYRQPNARTFYTLVGKSPADFDFTVKLFGGITHDPWKSGSQAKVDAELCRQFLDGIKPLVEAGRLGCILAQFPASMPRSEESWEYLLSLPGALDRLPLVYEFRHKDWISEETEQRLMAAGIGLAAVDEPQIGPLMPLVPKVTSKIAYLRLHGRSRYWFSKPALRYDYLYSDDELSGFLPIIDDMSSKSETLYVMFNNCHVGSATRNAKTLQDLLGIDAPPIQRPLL